MIATGPTGSDVSVNGGRAWSNFSDIPFDAVSCASDGACWASGPDGAVATFGIGGGSTYAPSSRRQSSARIVVASSSASGCSPETSDWMHRPSM